MEQQKKIEVKEIIWESRKDKDDEESYIGDSITGTIVIRKNNLHKGDDSYIGYMYGVAYHFGTLEECKKIANDLNQKRVEKALKDIEKWLKI